MADDAGRWLVETDWLASHLDTPGLVVVDGSMHLPTAKRDAKAEYLAEHIPGALFFDIDEISDKASSLPHMLPPPEKFASHMKKIAPRIPTAVYFHVWRRSRPIKLIRMTLHPR